MARVSRPSVGDIVAGLSVALVLIPQSIAYAVLAGMPAHTGLVVGGAAAITAAPFVSSPMLQTGPTAMTSLLTLGTLTAIAPENTPEYVALAPLLALMVGLIRIGVGASRGGEIAYLLSEPVLAGFTSAAAIVIAASQLPKILGVSPESSNILAAAIATLSDSGSWALEALGVALATIAIMLGARLVSPLVPGVFLAVVGGLLVTTLTGYRAAVVGDLPAGFTGFTFDLPWSQATTLLAPAGIIALVGFAEASAIARSFTSSDVESWDPDREFVSQGVANVASGLVGGFPVGGSFSRSTLNRHAGARSAWSGAVTGAAVLVTLPFVDVLEGLPEAVLGGIIVGAVVRLMDPRPILELRQYSRQQFVVATVTFMLTLALAPQIQWAVLVGIVLAVGAHLRRERYLTTDDWIEDGTLHLRPIGVLYFGSARRLEAQIGDLVREYEGVARLVIHLDRVGRTDASGAMALRTVLGRARESGLRVVVTDLTPPSRKIVTRVLAESGVEVEESAAG